MIRGVTGGRLLCTPVLLLLLFVVVVMVIVVVVVVVSSCWWAFPLLPLPPSPLTPGPMVLLQKKRERRMERTALREWGLAGPLRSATPTKPSLCLHTPAFLFSPTQTGMCALACVGVCLRACVYVRVCGCVQSLRVGLMILSSPFAGVFSLICFSLQVC